MPSPWAKLLATAMPAMQELNTPQYQDEADRQSTEPYNVQELDSAIADPRHQGPSQKQALLSEKQRIQQMQARQVQQQAQQFPQRLSDSLTLKQHTGMDKSPESMIVRLMVQMRRRSGMPRPQIGQMLQPQGGMGGPPAQAPF